MVRRLSAAALLATLLNAGPVLAQTSNEQDHAAAFSAGVKAIKEKRWADAYKIYSDLWREKQSYDVALSLGQTEFKLEQYVAAAEHLTYALKNMPVREDQGNRERAQAMLTRVREQVGAILINVSQEGAKVYLDDIEVGTSPLAREMYVVPGAHIVKALAEGFEPASSALAVSANQQATVSLELKSQAVSSLAAEPPKNEPARVTIAQVGRSPGADKSSLNISQSNWSTGKTAAVLTSGMVTMGALGVGAAFAVNASSARKEGDQDTYDSRVQTSRIAFAASGVAALTTIGLWLLWPNKNQSATALHVAPLLVHGSSGLLAAGEF